jgi:ketosteroid isomerase-like protein
MDRPTQLARALYEHYQRRNWAAARNLLHPDAVLEMPATRERLEGRQALMALQENYPEPWGDLTVLRVVGDDSRPTAAVELEIVGPTGHFRCAAFWVADAGLLTDGVEYWVTVGGEEPPPR